MPLTLKQKNALNLLRKQCKNTGLDISEEELLEYAKAGIRFRDIKKDFVKQKKKEFYNVLEGREYLLEDELNFPWRSLVADKDITEKIKDVVNKYPTVIQTYVRKKIIKGFKKGDPDALCQIIPVFNTAPPKLEKTDILKEKMMEINKLTIRYKFDKKFSNEYKLKEDIESLVKFSNEEIIRKKLKNYLIEFVRYVHPQKIKEFQNILREYNIEINEFNELFQFEYLSDPLKLTAQVKELIKNADIKVDDEDLGKLLKYPDIKNIYLNVVRDRIIKYVNNIFKEDIEIINSKNVKEVIEYAKNRAVNTKNIEKILSSPYLPTHYLFDENIVDINALINDKISPLYSNKSLKKQEEMLRSKLEPSLPKEASPKQLYTFHPVPTPLSANPSKPPSEELYHALYEKDNQH